MRAYVKCLRMAVAGLVLLGVTAEVRAQAAPDEWNVTVAPYLMAAGMNGTAGTSWDNLYVA